MAPADGDMVATDAEGTPMMPGDIVAQSSDGSRAPDFEVVTFGNEDNVKGEVVRLSQFFGQPVVVNFWFPSCPPCRAEMPDLEEAYQAHKSDGVVFIGVELLGLDSAKDGQDFVDEVGVSYAIGPDEKGSIIRAYKVVSFPTTVFLDKEHNTSKKWAGILTGGKLEELIQDALAP